MNLEEILAQLSQQAGPRGSTFAGRVRPQGDTTTLAGVLAQQPTESPDAEGMGAIAGSIAAGRAMSLPRATKQFTKGAEQIAQLAKSGVRPLSEPHKLWPAVINEKTGDIIHSMKPGPYQHAELFNSVANKPGYVSGFVDPTSYNAWTETMLRELEQRPRSAVQMFR